MTFWIWVSCQTGKTAWTVAPWWWMLSPLTRHLEDANKDKCLKFFCSVKCMVKKNDREKLRMSFQSQRWINYTSAKWRQCAFSIELKDIHLNHAKHVQSYLTQDVTLMPNLLSRTSVGSSSICSYSSPGFPLQFFSQQNQAGCISSL